MGSALNDIFGNQKAEAQFPPVQPGETLAQYAMRTAQQTGFDVGSLGALLSQASSYGAPGDYAAMLQGFQKNATTQMTPQEAQQWGYPSPPPATDVTPTGNGTLGPPSITAPVTQAPIQTGSTAMPKPPTPPGGTSTTTPPPLPLSGPSSAPPYIPPTGSPGQVPTGDNFGITNPEGSAPPGYNMTGGTVPANYNTGTLGGLYPTSTGGPANSSLFPALPTTAPTAPPGQQVAAAARPGIAPIGLVGHASPLTYGFNPQPTTPYRGIANALANQNG